MLMRLLQLVAEGGVHSYATLADQLGVSTGLLEQMLRDLARGLTLISTLSGGGVDLRV